MNAEQSINKGQRANTISGVAILPGRMTGNSTRQVDKAIQLLFEGFVVEVRDHYEDGHHNKMNHMLFARVLNRLSAEHQNMMIDGKIQIDYNKLTIELK